MCCITKTYDKTNQKGKCVASQKLMTRQTCRANVLHYRNTYQEQRVVHMYCIKETHININRHGTCVASHDKIKV
jgi:hypothetical protein